MTTQWLDLHARVCCWLSSKRTPGQIEINCAQRMIDEASNQACAQEARHIKHLLKRRQVGLGVIGVSRRARCEYE